MSTFAEASTAQTARDGTSAECRSLNKPPTKPIVCVVGPTGSGKSQLAIDLALALERKSCSSGEGPSALPPTSLLPADFESRYEGAEIVNCDVIQMYRGLDIASAKVTVEETRGVPHHLMSFLLPRAQFSVREFRSLALACIADIYSRKKVPIVVGGTAYYCQALLRRDGGTLEGVEGREGVEATETEAASSSSASSSAVDADAGGVKQADLEALELYARLQRVDPIMARRLHPNDTRKIQRALDAYDKSGGTINYSQMLLMQQHHQKGSEEAVFLDEDSFVVWTTVEDKKEHDARLDKRIARMMEGGKLIEEIKGLKGYLEATEGLVIKAAASCSDGDGDGGLGGRGLLRALTVDVDDHSDGNADAKAAREAASRFLRSDHKPTALTTRLLGEHLAKEEAKSKKAGGLIGFFVPPVASSAGSSAASSLSSSFSATEEGPRSASSASSATNASTDGSSYRGLMQAIGFKEFSAYLASLSKSAGHDDGTEPPPAKRGRWTNDKDKEKGEDEEGEGEGEGGGESSSALLLEQSIQKLKDTTHHYARVQQRFIRNRFHKQGLRMMVLDTSGPSVASSSSSAPTSFASFWSGSVVSPAFAAVSRWLITGEKDDNGSTAAPAPTMATAFVVPTLAPTPAPASVPVSDVQRTLSWRKFVCEGCSNERRWSMGMAPLPPIAVVGEEDEDDENEDDRRYDAWKSEAGVVVMNGDKEREDHYRSKGHHSSTKRAKLREMLAKERGIVLQPKSMLAGKDKAGEGGKA